MISIAKPSDFPIGSPESRAAARMRLDLLQASRKRLEIVVNFSPSGEDPILPHAGPWQETVDGGLMRIVYHPAMWLKLPLEPIPVCSGCGTPFRRTEQQLGGLVVFEAACVRQHILDYGER